MCVYWGCPQGSDQGCYLQTAHQLHAIGAWYPHETNLHEMYIWAPGLINWFILQLHLFDTLNYNYLFNFLMGIALVFYIRRLATRFFSEPVGYVAAGLWCLLYSNWWVVLNAGTELPFLFLALSALNLAVKGDVKHLILAGILLALGNWIRPLMVIFSVPILLYFIFKKFHWSHYLALLIPYATCSVLFGWLAQEECGHFVTQAQTGGINLIMTANDKAYGGVQSSLVSDSTSSLWLGDELTDFSVLEKDSIWMARGKEWVIDHPVQYGFLYIKKLVGLFIEDSWADRAILGGDGQIDRQIDGGWLHILALLSDRILKSLVFYFCLLAALVTLFKHRREWFSWKGYLLLIAGLGTGATCLFSVSPRYHYPFTFVFCIWAAYGVCSYLDKLNKRPQ